MLCFVYSISFCSLTFPCLLSCFSFVHEKPDCALSGNRNSPHEEFALVIKTIVIIKVYLELDFAWLISFPIYFYLVFSHDSDPLYLLLFLCTSWVSFPVVTVRLPVALDLGQRRMFNHYWSFPWVSLQSIFPFSCVPPSLVRQLGIFFSLFRCMES